MLSFILSTSLFLVAVLHLFFLVLEMFFWTKPLGMKVFRNNSDYANKSKVLAANMGLYNGFLAAGLFWSVFANSLYAFELRVFFLACVIVAGVYGAFSVGRKIFFIQALPALLVTFLLLYLRFSS